MIQFIKFYFLCNYQLKVNTKAQNLLEEFQKEAF
jgi:hypothetical protein